LAAGEEVIILDNLSTGNLRNVETALRSRRCIFLFGDVAQPVEQLAPQLEFVLSGRRLNKIYHLASPASPEVYGSVPRETMLANSVGTMAVVDLALDHGARLLYTSTSGIYGDPLVHPQTDSYSGNVDPIGERAYYDEGKRFGEAAISVAVRSRGLDARIVRLFNCYGPRMPAAGGRLIPALIEAADAAKPLPVHGTGLQTRSMTYVSDAIELIELVMRQEQIELKPVNVGNDDERTVLDIARTFAGAAKIAFEVEHVDGRPSDPQRRKPDLELARSFGWEPRISLEVGLGHTIEWFRTMSVSYV
jgi:nucleoside-diphosphate-sugar epimerase